MFEILGPGAQRPTRRRFLAGLGAAGALTALAPARRLAQAGAATARWHDPSSWPSGRVPGPTDIAVITGPILVDLAAAVAGIQIKPGGSLTLSPSSTVALVSTGNVIVEGTLTMRPAATTSHLLQFVGVNEARFVGGGLDPVTSDVGLWVIGAGVLDVAGTSKQVWTRATTTVAAGAMSITVADAPVGWRPGDELVVSPTEVATGNTNDVGYWSNFDVVSVAAISGTTVTLAGPVAVDHPLVNTGRGAFGAEVLNVTTNARIEGTPGGRSHVFLRSTRPQSISGLGVRHMGPRKGGAKVAGRWPIHFHSAGEGSRGSVADGVVVRDAGSHAFVSHLSNGVTFQDCVAFDVQEHAYWWDEGASSDDTLITSCVAAKVSVGGFSVGGFYLAKGSRNTIENCVATGVDGVDGAGIISPSQRDNGEWVIVDCVAHNNRNAGFKAYINTDQADNEVVTRLTAYGNDFGIDHGAYSNTFVYDSCTLFDNPSGGVRLRAVAQSSGIQFLNLLVDQDQRGAYGVVNGRHVASTTFPTTFSNCTFLGNQVAAIGLVTVDPVPDLLDVVDCAFSGNQFWLGNTINRQSRIVFRQGTSTQTLRRKDQPGVLVPAWNARVT